MICDCSWLWFDLGLEIMTRRRAVPRIDSINIVVIIITSVREDSLSIVHLNALIRTNIQPGFVKYSDCYSTLRCISQISQNADPTYSSGRRDHRWLVCIHGLHNAWFSFTFHAPLFVRHFELLST